MKQKIMIFNLCTTGHGLVHAPLFIQAALSRDCDVVYAGEECDASTPGWVNLTTYWDRVEPMLFPVTYIGLPMEPQRLCRWRLSYKRFIESLSSSDASLILIPYFDHILLPLAIFGLPKNIKNKLIRGTILSPPLPQNIQIPTIARFKSRLKAWLLDRVASIPQIDRLYTYDPRVPKESYTFTKKCEWLPDPMVLGEFPDQAKAREALQLPTTQPIVALVGALSHRKGLKLLLDVMSSADMADVVLLAAGADSTGDPSFFSSGQVSKLQNRNRLYLKFGWLSDKDFTAVVSAADIIWVVYENFHGMASLIVHAATSGTPVIGTENTLIGHMIEQHSLGITTGEHNVEQAIHGIKLLLSDSSPFDIKKANLFAEQHTIGAFFDKWFSDSEPAAELQHS